MLVFRPVTLEDSELLIPHLKKYSSDSCQHSFSLMLGLSQKYGDEFCFYENILFVHRSRQDSEGKRVYLAPLGNIEADSVRYINLFFDDARKNNCKLSFETVTDEFVHILENYYPGVFQINSSRDMAEYIYTTEKLSTLPGSKLAAKRNKINAFNATFPDTRIEKITDENIDQIKAYQAQWHAQRNSYKADPRLDIENNSINLYLDNFKRLRFSGIAVYVNNKIVGYAAGVALSDNCMDEVIEKGDRDVIGIYQILCQAFAQVCCADYMYINREEDIGIEGLRRAKESYKPDYLINKYYATEI